MSLPNANASVAEQKKTLKNFEKSFEKLITEKTSTGLRFAELLVFQINVGKICNQACSHCHVDASPKRTETMRFDTAKKCMEIVEKVGSIKTIDITGGAPEINQHFKYLVETSKKLGKHVIDRCNLTILEEKGYEYLYDFLFHHQVEIIASLPHYSSMRTDQQRGKGVFDVSIKVLKKLNAMGYGKKKELPLNLVYNPTGAFLSGSQTQLESEFKENLLKKYGIVFNHLYCINNMPISRFLASLVKRNKLEDYMQTLVSAFNLKTLDNLMCRHQVSVGYEGSLYDCDFNQMLEIKASPVGHIDDWESEAIGNRFIKVANHCYGCTAGAGSSCGGEVV